MDDYQNMKAEAGRLRRALQRGQGSLVSAEKRLKRLSELRNTLALRNRGPKDRNEALEQQLEERTHDLKSAYRELSQREKLSTIERLAAGIVHEALNPLSVVVACIDLLQADVENAMSHAQKLDAAREGVQRTVDILTNLQDFSARRSQKKTDVKISELLASTGELLSFELRQREIECDVNIEESIILEGDPDRLRQVFLNLAKNAMKAIDREGRLTLGIEQSGDGNPPAVYVRDTGPGISADIREDLFEPFRTTKEDGTGLGLSICREVIEEHGGEIRVESLTGRGTCFWVTFAAQE